MTDCVSLFILLTCYIEAEYLAPRNPDPCGMHWRHQASPLFLAFSNLDFPLSRILIFCFTLLFYTHFCKMPELHFEQNLDIHMSFAPAPLLVTCPPGDQGLVRGQ